MKLNFEYHFKLLITLCLWYSMSIQMGINIFFIWRLSEHYFFYILILKFTNGEQKYIL